MSEIGHISALTGALARVGTLASSLTGYPSGRLGSGCGRRVRTALTAALVVTGLSAWALAVVQPWVGRGASMAMVSMGGGVDAGRLRTAAVDFEKAISENPALAPPSLRRNPFGPAPSHPSQHKAAAGWDQAGMGGMGHEDEAPSQQRAAASLDQAGMGAGPTPKHLMETAKGLKVEMILTAPSGERWVVINGESYREGDAVAGMEIVEIQGTRIKLQHAGMTCLLRMD